MTDMIVTTPEIEDIAVTLLDADTTLNIAVAMDIARDLVFADEYENATAVYTVDDVTRDALINDARESEARDLVFADEYENATNYGETDANGKCRRCAGTGQFITMMVNGVPKGPGGPCFRCNGKGYQNDDDRRRNWGYDRFGVRVSL